MKNLLRVTGGPAPCLLPNEPARRIVAGFKALQIGGKILQLPRSHSMEEVRYLSRCFGAQEGLHRIPAGQADCSACGQPAFHQESAPPPGQLLLNDPQNVVPMVSRRSSLWARLAGSVFPSRFPIDELPGRLPKRACMSRSQPAGRRRPWPPGLLARLGFSCRMRS